MKIPKGWTSVKTTDFYGEYEEAKGIPKNAKTVIVLWPNGVQTCNELVVVDGEGSAQVDMNCYPDHFRTRKMFVKISYYGHEVLVRLKGLPIKAHTL